MRFRTKEGLGLRVPPSTFTIDQVREHVGSSRIVDVMDVRTQEALTMTMRGESWEIRWRQKEKKNIGGTADRVGHRSPEVSSPSRVDRVLQRQGAGHLAQRYQSGV